MRGWVCVVEGVVSFLRSMQERADAVAALEKYDMLTDADDRNLAIRSWVSSSLGVTACIAMTPAGTCRCAGVGAHAAGVRVQHVRVCGSLKFQKSPISNLL